MNGKIYTLRCVNDDTLIYVGSTIHSLECRFNEHKKSSRNKKRTEWKIYKAIAGDWENWYIELYEDCPCNTLEELRKREGEIIKEVGSLNTYIAGRTKKEWCEDNKERLELERKVYYQNNKEKNKEKRKKYYQANKEKNKEARKRYYETHREQIAKGKRDWYIKRKAQ